MKGEYKMRKFVKTLAICAMTAAMAVGMGCIAFADEVDPEMTFKVVGSEGLVGEEWKEAASTDSTEPGAPGEMGLMTETENKGIYSVTFNVTTPDNGEGDTKNEELTKSTGYEFPVGYEFKILRAADTYAWTYQCTLGNPYMAWADNQTQFKLPEDFTGEVTIYLDINTGAVVCADKDGKAIDYMVRWKSREEDPWNFTAVDKKEIEASKNESTGAQNANCNDVAQLNADLAKTVGVTMESTGSSSSDDAEETTPAKDDNNETTVAPKEESSSNTGVIVVVVVVVVVVIAGVAIVLTKKKN